MKKKQLSERDISKYFNASMIELPYVQADLELKLGRRLTVNDLRKKRKKK